MGSPHQGIAIYVVGESAPIPGLKKGQSVAGESEHLFSSSKEGTKSCWRRSSRGNDCQLTLELDLDNWRLLIPSPDLGIYVLLIVPIVGAMQP